MADVKSSTKSVVAQSPLMSVIEYEGQPRYTMQYFHRQYIENSETGKGKYREFKNFARAVRSMENYTLHRTNGDIVELDWSRIKAEVAPNLSQSLAPLFQATGYKPLALLNAAAQVSLTYHLDNDLSREISVAASTLVARQGQPPFATSQALLDRDAEIAFLQRAEAFLVHLGQLNERDKLMIADQTRNLMQVGQRLLPAPNGTTETAHGFSVAERAAQLGYQLTRQQQAVLYVQLGKLIAAQYRARYKDNPKKELRYIDGAMRKVGWYAEKDTVWIDSIIQGFLGQFLS